jgi:endonuclease/exonuclease/phosphatase family metal-dependent hydrolase
MTVANRRFVLERMRTAIRSFDAELVFLQEVQGQHHHRAQRFADTWPVAGQCEFLADSIWPHHAYGRNALYDHGHHGNAILSKYPFISWDNLDVSNNRFERRGLLHGIIHHPTLGQDLHLICCHLDLFERGRRQQISKLIARINDAIPRSAPLLIAGDFNDWRTRISPHLAHDLGLIEVHHQLHGNHARTFPVWWPMLRLDRLYARGLTPSAAKSLTGDPWATLSDHAALFAEFADITAPIAANGQPHLPDQAE